MAMRVKIKGLKELDKALSQLKHTTAKSVGRRVLKEAAKPIAAEAAARAPKGADHNLTDSIAVSTKLSKSQRKKARRSKRKDTVTVHVGTNDPAGLQQEYGNVNHGPQPFMRSAWDGNKNGALDIIAKLLRTEIEKAAARARKKALKNR